MKIELHRENLEISILQAISEMCHIKFTLCSKVNFIPVPLYKSIISYAVSDIGQRRNSKV
jgi:hypothetical protein